MTRMAPRSSAGLHASQSLLDVRWRVGVRGSLTLTVLPGGDAESAVAIIVFGSDRFVLAGKVDDATREVRFAFSATSDGRRITEDHDCHGMPENPVTSGRQACFDGFNLAVCANPGAPEPDRLLLTDLPTQLGLMGGTYVLESIRAGF